MAGAVEYVGDWGNLGAEASSLFGYYKEIRKEGSTLANGRKRKAGPTLRKTLSSGVGRKKDDKKSPADSPGAQEL